MSDRLDPLSGLRPSRPPTELRAQVLSAAAEASMRPRVGIVESLATDRTLRWLAAAILVLTILNAAAGHGATVESRQDGPRAFPLLSGDDFPPQIDLRSSAAEQAPEIKSILDGRQG